MRDVWVVCSCAPFSGEKRTLCEDREFKEDKEVREDREFKEKDAKGLYFSP